jgi:hypothetical protein
MDDVLIAAGFKSKHSKAIDRYDDVRSCEDPVPRLFSELTYDGYSPADHVSGGLTECRGLTDASSP